MAPNLSIHAIPVYWAMALWPHASIVSLLKEADSKFKMDNVNPRGAANSAQIKESLPPHVYAKYERCEAAHKNLLENAPLFIGAVVVGNLAKLDTSTLNTYVGAYLGLRAIYVVLYLNTVTRKNAIFRTVNFIASLGVLFTVYIKAGNKLAF